MADEKRLRHILDLARGCVHRAQAHQALGHLNSIEEEIDELHGTSLWAEHKLIFAGTLGAMNDSDAGLVFREAIDRVSSLSSPDPTLEMLCHEDFAKYLAERRSLNRSREQYGLAERIAEELNLPEDVARFQMCIIRIDLEERKDPKFPAFQRLKEAAKDGYTFLEQREAWIQYNDTFLSYGRKLVATRKGQDSSVEFFRFLLSQTRRRRSESVT